ncbi:hypothetical protein PHLCEN_2v5555 [Hermanssonia centrifuga]|uniref:Uncharacterized protein n=1 Tax=Hermanssonia centrifuga TaxID=98765 RepID=A0A2R6P255_9APHY|nr:hypothetical protein PHLCEN_2v5555 [Hermanssonia centrifuga]
MHALDPPMKVILREVSITRDCYRVIDAYRLEYTPGIRASLTASGSGWSQRSGFHSRASAPQIALLLLHDRLPTAISVPLGTTTSFINEPSNPRTGLANGMITSCTVL